MFSFEILILENCKQLNFNNQKLVYWTNNKILSIEQRNNKKSYPKRANTLQVYEIPWLL